MNQRTPWRITMNKQAMVAKSPLGPGFSQQEAENAESMSVAFLETLGSDDYVKYTLYDSTGKILKEKTTYVYEL